MEAMHQRTDWELLRERHLRSLVAALEARMEAREITQGEIV
jgi:hypothetical protein